VEAWVRVRGSSDEARQEARDRFVVPLLQLAEQTGGHLPEIADADPPHAARGCPAQAWSVAEILRLEASVLMKVTGAKRAPHARKRQAPV
jgi:glycogen debranching enzyme